MITEAQEHAQRNRGTIFVEQGEVLSHEAWPGDQYILRIRAPKCAAAARPGTFIHVSCDEIQPACSGRSASRSCCTKTGRGRC